MMGTAIVAIPMYYAEAGLLLGLVMTVVIGGISSYTALLVVEQAEASKTQEYSGLARYYLGFPMQITSWVMGILVITGAVIVYHILMQESLYSIVLSIAVAAGNGHAPSVWTHYGRIISAAVVWLLWPLANMQDLQVLVKFNSVGFLFLVYTVTFILVNGFIGLGFGDYEVLSHLKSGESEFNVDTGNMQVVLFARETFVPLAGTLMLSTFIHNAIQPICKNAPKETRSYDVFYGYLIASVLYMLIGVLGYFGFAALKPGKGVNLALQSNFLDMFGSTFTKGLDIYAFTARLSLFFQLVTVFPILLMIIRTQFFGYLMQTTWPGQMYVAALNFGIMALSFALAAMNMDVGTVVRITGALGGLVLIYLVPLGSDLVKTARDGDGTVPWSKWLINIGLIVGAACLLALQFVPALTG